MLRVLRDRQLQDGKRAGHHQHDRDHPGEYRPVDKNFAMRGSLTYCFFVVGGWRLLRRLQLGAGLGGHDLDAGTHHLQTLDDHLVARRQPRADQPLVAHAAVGLQGAQFDLVLGVDHHRRRLAALVARHAALRHQQALAGHAVDQAGAHEHARQQPAVGIGKHRPQRDRTRARIHRDFRELQLALLLVLRAVFQRQRDRDCSRVGAGQHRWPALPAAQRLLDCVTSTYIGSICCTAASAAACVPSSSQRDHRGLLAVAQLAAGQRFQAQQVALDCVVDDTSDRSAARRPARQPDWRSPARPRSPRSDDAVDGRRTPWCEPG